LPVVFLADRERLPDIGKRRYHHVDCEGVERHQAGEKRNRLARSGADRIRGGARREGHRACWRKSPLRATGSRQSNAGEATMIVHHLENSRSQRLLWLLEELGIDYEVKRYARDSESMLAPPELRQVHPLGKSPLLEENGLVLAESGAIVEYLVDKVGGRFGPPADRDAALRYRMFLHYAEGSLMPPLLALLVVRRLGLLGLPARKPLLGMFARHLDFLDTELAGRDWFAGDEISAADVMMSFPLEAATNRAGLGPDRKYLWAWLERIHARPAYQRALAAGGPYAYA
jgi:glutathione S-transferase